jgi:hypothetical protein
VAEEELRFTISPATEADSDFVKDSWRKSYRHSPLTGKWPSQAYAVWIADHMERLLKRSKVIVARPVGWQDGVTGWLAYEQLPGLFCAHYAFVRPLFRQQGVLTELVNSAEPSGEKVFSSLRLPYCLALERLGFRFRKEASHREKT